MEESEAAISQEEWDAANAAFHEFQIDLAGNEMLSHVYRELSVNLMMQVIRGGKLEGGEYLAREHRAIVDAFDAGDLAGGPAGDPDAHRVGEGHRARRDRARRRRALTPPRNGSSRPSIRAGRADPWRRTSLGSSDGRALRTGACSTRASR